MASSADKGGPGNRLWAFLLGGMAAAVAVLLYMMGVFSPVNLPGAVPVSKLQPETGEVVQETPKAPKPAPDSQDVGVATTEGQADDGGDAAAQAETPPEPGQTGDGVAASPDVPSFDVVRVEPDGTTLIAGRSTPGSRVVLMVDNAPQDQIEVSADGSFVSFQQFEFSDAPRVLSLVAQIGGRDIASADQIILAPSSPAAPPVSQGGVDSVVASVTPQEAQAPDTPDTAPEGSDGQTATPPGSPPASTAQDEPREPTPDSSAPPVVASAPTMTSPASENGSRPILGAGSGEETAAVKTPPAEPDTSAQQPDEPAPVTTAPGTSPEIPAPETPKAQPVETAQAPAAPSLPAGADESVALSGAQDSEPTQIAVLRAGAGGVELLQPSAPEEPASVSSIALDTIGYSDQGDVQLSGRSRPASLIRVYLDNDAVADLVADSEGRWKVRLDDVKPGIYTLRLDELGAGGNVVSRIETPFKREAPEVLQAPAQPVEIAGTQGTAPVPQVRAVTVQAGDTLWAISRERYGDGVLYVRVFEANRDAIRDPDLIYPGQVFEIPQ